MCLTKKLLIFLFLLALQAQLYAQATEVMYETYVVSDSATDLQIKMEGELSVQPWSSNQIMVQTEVLLEGATPDVLSFFVKEGRYETRLDTVMQDKVYALRSKEGKRRSIKYKDSEVFEQIKVSIFIPKSFRASADSLQWSRIP